MSAEHKTMTVVIEGGMLDGEYLSRCSCEWTSSLSYTARESAELAGLAHEIESEALQ